MDSYRKFSSIHRVYIGKEGVCGKRLRGLMSPARFLKQSGQPGHNLFIPDTMFKFIYWNCSAVENFVNSIIEASIDIHPITWRIQKRYLVSNSPHQLLTSFIIIGCAIQYIFII